MDKAILKFKYQKLIGLYRKHGVSYAFQFLMSKAKRAIRNTFFYQSGLHNFNYSLSQHSEALASIDLFTNKPVFSIIMPVYNVDERWLRKAIESVKQQVYPYWELCIADDASTKEHIKAVLNEYAAVDKRIKLLFREQSGNISAASNSALTIATGEYMVLLDNDDELTVDALYENAKLINKHPDADFIYSDEDKIDAHNKHFDAWFKPNWSPEYLLSYMYTCHLSVYRKQLVDKVGGFRSPFDGAQDYDLCLRITERTKAIYHIPKILYHWRTIGSSTAANPLSKQYAYEAGRKAVEEHIQRTLGTGTVSFTDYYGVYKVNHSIRGNPLVSIIIPSAGKWATIHGKNVCLLENCIDSVLERSSYQKLELIVVDGNDVSPETITYTQNRGVKWVHCNDPFNFSQRINIGVQASSGEYVLMLNDDIEIITPDWIEQLLWLAQQQSIGAVGAKLITEKKQVQHAGIILEEVSPGHIFYGLPDIGQGYLNGFCAYRNYLAVTGACILVSRAKYDAVNGLNELFPVNYNDVDFCLKLHQLGLRNVFSPHAVLYHYESISRGKGFKAEELLKFTKAWETYEPAFSDPYHNPNLIVYPQLLA